MPSIRFFRGEEEFDLDPGDFCLVRRGERFHYENNETQAARLVLFHTPAFDLGSEVFLDGE